MKKILFSLIAFMAIGSLYAQSIELGVKGGLNVSGYHGKDVDGGSPLISYHVGVTSELRLTDKLSVQPELVYSVTGGEKEKDFTVTTLEVKQEVRYVSVPLLAKYYVLEGLSLELGPQFSYAVARGTNSGDILDKLKALPKPALDAIEKGIDMPYNEFDIAVGAGLSYKLPFGLFASARYLYSFTSYPKDLDIKPQVLQVSLGYRF